MSRLNNQPFALRLKRGLRSALHLLATEAIGVSGEPAYTTDTKQLFIHDGTGNRPLQSLDMAVTFEGNVVVHNNDVVYTY